MLGIEQPRLYGRLHFPDRERFREPGHGSYLRLMRSSIVGWRLAGWMAFGAMCIQHLQLLLREPLAIPFAHHGGSMRMQQH